MSAKRYQVSLSEEERQSLQQLVGKGIRRSREITRARILLLADAGQSDQTNDAQSKFARLYPTIHN